MFFFFFPQITEIRIRKNFIYAQGAVKMHYHIIIIFFVDEF